MPEPVSSSAEIVKRVFQQSGVLDWLVAILGSSDSFLTSLEANSGASVGRNPDVVAVAKRGSLYFGGGADAVYSVQVFLDSGRAVLKLGFDSNGGLATFQVLASSSISAAQIQKIANETFNLLAWTYLQLEENGEAGSKAKTTQPYAVPPTKAYNFDELDGMSIDDVERISGAIGHRIFNLREPFDPRVDDADDIVEIARDYGMLLEFKPNHWAPAELAGAFRNVDQLLRVLVPAVRHISTRSQPPQDREFYCTFIRSKIYDVLSFWADSQENALSVNDKPKLLRQIRANLKQLSLTLNRLEE